MYRGCTATESVIHDYSDFHGYIRNTATRLETYHTSICKIRGCGLAMTQKLHMCLFRMDEDCRFVHYGVFCLPIRIFFGRILQATDHLNYGTGQPEKIQYSRG